ncbi:MAG: hypothetical protein SV377_05140, partial [Halobacteria archaeon]|nr:hypothetical protein [Halobacteria archaeon]
DLGNRIVSEEKSDSKSDLNLSDVGVRALILGVLVSVIVGNLYFWGNLNILGEIQNPNNGFISLYGPYYHFDILLPVSVFVGSGGVVAFRRVRKTLLNALPERRAVAVSLVALLIGTSVFVGVGGVMVQDKFEENVVVTQNYQKAYQPFEDRDFENALIFLPTPYGNWLNHPFQYLRNDPDLNGEEVYALDRGTENFEVIEAYGDRNIYRYTYRGEWEPYTRGGVVPRIQRLRVVQGERLSMETSIGVPSDVKSVSVRVGTGRNNGYYALNLTRTQIPDDLVLTWTITRDKVVVNDTKLEPIGDSNRSVSHAGNDTIQLIITLTRDNERSITYTQELTVSVTEERIKAITPPHTGACYTSLGCDGKATYIPDESPENTYIKTNIEDANKEG